MIHWPSYFIGVATLPAFWLIQWVVSDVLAMRWSTQHTPCLSVIRAPWQWSLHVRATVHRWRCPGHRPEWTGYPYIGVDDPETAGKGCSET